MLVSLRFSGFLRLPPLSRPPYRLGVWIGEMRHIAEGRRAIAEMDARMLADIGLSRADAEEELRRAPWDAVRRER